MPNFSITKSTSGLRAFVASTSGKRAERRSSAGTTPGMSSTSSRSIRWKIGFLRSRTSSGGIGSPNVRTAYSGPAPAAIHSIP
jgi:hypothetical protein